MTERKKKLKFFFNMAKNKQDLQQNAMELFKKFVHFIKLEKERINGKKIFFSWMVIFFFVFSMNCDEWEWKFLSRIIVFLIERKSIFKKIHTLARIHLSLPFSSKSSCWGLIMLLRFSSGINSQEQMCQIWKLESIARSQR